MSYYREFTPIDAMDSMRRYNPIFCNPTPQAYDSDQGYHSFDNFGPSTRLGPSAVTFNPMTMSDAACNQHDGFFANSLHTNIGHPVVPSYMAVEESHVFLQQSTSYYPGSIIHEEPHLPSAPYDYSDYSEQLQVPSVQPQHPILPRSSPPQENTSPPPSPVSPTGVTGSESEDSERDRSHPCSYCSKAFARAHDRKRHERIHTGETPYHCFGCKSYFKRPDARARHWNKNSACRQLDAELVRGTPEGIKREKREISRRERQIRQRKLDEGLVVTQGEFKLPLPARPRKRV